MSGGQQAFGAQGVAASRALEDRLAEGETARGAAHAAQLQLIGALHEVHVSMGLGLSTAPIVALQLRCSEDRAGRLLADALGLAELAGAWQALSSGVLTVEQSSVVVAQLAVVSPPARAELWQRLLARLQEDVEQGSVCPPARLAELLRRWVVEADPDGAVRRRRDAAAGRRVDRRRREDGLADLFLLGLTGPQAQACLARIEANARPVSSADERTADQRRLDAAVDLLLGRTTLPLETTGTPPDPTPVDDCDVAASDTGGRCGSGCGCRVGAVVPCGADVVVLVPLGGALGVTDEAGELVGHGPVEPDLLAELLLSAPALRAVFVDEHGVPVAVGSQVQRPPGTIPPRSARHCWIWPPHQPASGTPATPTTTPRHPTTRRVPGCRRPGGRIRHASVVPTGYGGGWRGWCRCARRAASGRPAGCAPPAATWSTTRRTRPGRPAPATWVRCADTITGASSSAGPSAAVTAARSGSPARPAAPSPAGRSTAHRSPRSGPCRRCPARCGPTSS